MIEIIEVKTKKDIKAFIEFPLNLYKGCPYFVPMIYGDEKKLIRESGKNDIAKTVFYLAKRGKEVVGRIQGIIHKQYNQLKNESRVRFTRFDSIDDKEVSHALFKAVEDWARADGMTQLCGPLGYSDLDREGLLIEGFEENNTYEEQYNYSYYPALLEDYGFEKEVDWLEFELTAPKERHALLQKTAKRVLELNKLHVAQTKGISKKAFIEKYADSFFDALDVCYSKLYGTMPITPEQRKEILEQFMLVININYFVFICNEREEVVAFGISFPAFGDALKKSGGRLTIPTLIRLLKAIKKPKKLDLGLVGVRPEYQNTGVNAVIVNGMIDFFEDGGIESCETNLNLETNTQVMSQWKYLTARQHKRRRAYIKNIETEKENA